MKGACIAFLLATALAVCSGWDDADQPEPDLYKIEDLILSVIEDFRSQLKQGVPDKNIPPLDPMDIKHQDVFISLNDTLRLNGSVSNVSGSNLLSFNVTQLKAKVSPIYLEIRLDWAPIDVEGIYDIDGHLLSIIPIYGNGTFATGQRTLVHEQKTDASEDSPWYTRPWCQTRVPFHRQCGEAIIVGSKVIKRPVQRCYPSRVSSDGSKWEHSPLGVPDVAVDGGNFDGVFGYFKIEIGSKGGELRLKKFEVDFGIRNVSVSIENFLGGLLGDMICEMINENLPTMVEQFKMGYLPGIKDAVTREVNNYLKGKSLDDILDFIFGFLTTTTHAPEVTSTTPVN